MSDHVATLNLSSTTDHRFGILAYEHPLAGLYVIRPQVGEVLITVPSAEEVKYLGRGIEHHLMTAPHPGLGLVGR